MFKFGTILSVFFSILLGQTTASMPDTVVFVGGKNISIPVTITDVVKLEGLEFTVQYDETVLTAMSTSFNNTELEGMNFNVSIGLDISGEIMVVVYAATNPLFTGSGNLLFINFDVVGQLLESTSLTFTSIEINNVSILENAQNGSVIVHHPGCGDKKACNYDTVHTGSLEGCIYENDCAGVCGGTAELDECYLPVCSGGTTGLAANSSCTDCNGDVNGIAIADCNDVCEGTAELDDCILPVCVGGDTGLVANATCTDCNGSLNGSAIVDECGICGGDSSCSDECGVPYGDNSSCADECGIPNGDNSSCTDCAGIPNGNTIEDACGVCEGDGSDDLGCGCLEPGPSGCDNTCGSTLVDDACGVCGGDGSADLGCGCFEPAAEDDYNCDGVPLANDLLSPFQFELLPNYPNPFNPTTTINYSIGIFSGVNISIYSINGELIQTLVHSSKQAGQYAVQWNALNFPSGLYFVKLISSNNIAEQKILFIK